jgi:hypothetical protein
MVRECAGLVLLAAAMPGCSFILNFDEPLPVDAAPDAVYTQSECEYMEPNDTLATAAMISAGDTGPAAICAPDAGSSEDRDFYKFTATGTPAVITLNFTARPGGDLDLKLYDATGTMISSSREFGGSERIECPGSSPACPALTAGEVYTFEVFAGVTGAVNSYTFSVTQQ